VLPVWINVGLILSLVVWLHGQIFIPSGDATHDSVTRPRADLMIFYGAAVIAKTDPSQLYDVDRQGAAQKAATGLEISGRDIDFLPYPYPPILAFAMVPFTFVGYKTAYALMIILNLALLGICVWLLSSRLKLDREANQVLVLCTAASISVYATLVEGQVSFLSLLFYILVVTNLRAGNDARAGTWAGFLVFKPTLLPVWLYWFAIRQRWRAFGCAVAVSAAMLLASTLAVGRDGILGYLKLSHQMMADIPGAHPDDMPILRAVTYFFGLSDSVWLVTAAILLLVLWKAKLPKDWEYCIVIMASILAAPYVQPQDTAVLLIVLALILLHTTPSWVTTWGLMAFTLWHAIARLVFAGNSGNHWPVMPPTFIFLAAYLWYRGSRLRAELV
jgi:glycosyl transferase family 87